MMGSDRKRAPRLTLRGKLAVLATAALAAYVWLSSRANSDVILLRNAAGSEAHILKIGAIIQKLLVPDSDGNFADVVLGFDEEARYLRDSPYFGAVVGRVANRIANATFELDGATYRLATNEGGKTDNVPAGTTQDNKPLRTIAYAALRGTRTTGAAERDLVLSTTAVAPRLCSAAAW